MCSVFGQGKTDVLSHNFIQGNESKTGVLHQEVDKERGLRQMYSEFDMARDPRQVCSEFDKGGSPRQDRLKAKVCSDLDMVWSCREIHSQIE